MRERPILFTGPMVRAILAGNKTQTRRVAKEFAGRDDLDAILTRFPNQNGCPYGQPGERLWVREAFRFAASLDRLSPNDVGEKALDAGYNTPWAPTQFEADGRRAGAWHGFDTPPTGTTPGKLRPGIHMPRWACRLVLEITGVRVERLQDISGADCWAEGIEECDGSLDEVEICRLAKTMGRTFEDPQPTYAALWEQINGAGSWLANPWVWVVEFRRADTDKKEM
ncbi:Uncharacterised protein [Achromobacter sp. 2789STDY5608633]|uniref:ASCH domain-containing protein n=1 Tax=Achromobacter insuavis TaxID=1287735 RepID=A0A6J4ZI96_9BURK|nr:MULTISPECIES: hypothetical protein [Achromobacter]CAB3627931.1 hypothetical protein LMG26845_00514 [Achromobacter insuavis]CUJ58383.1 Uncharacterised protein [Achromobacter sp. 2789STDY5608633]